MNQEVQDGTVPKQRQPSAQIITIWLVQLPHLSLREPGALSWSEAKTPQTPEKLSDAPSL